jgi:hypothetical protein
MLGQTVTKEAVILKLSDLPPDGLAEVARFIDFLQFKTGKKSRVPRTRAGEHPGFGIWADRAEAQDPVQFTEHLRCTIEARQDG